MWICYFIPIVVHLIFLPFLFSEGSGGIMLVEIFVGTILAPIYLVIVSYNRLEHFSMSKFFPALLIILTATILGILMIYFNWGIVTGNLLKPDSETIHITNWQIIIASMIAIVGWIIVYMIKRRAS